MKLPSILVPAALALCTAVSSHATITLGSGVSASTQNELSNASTTAYSGDVSTTDILNGITPIFNGNWFTSGGRTPANFTDGLHGAGGEVGSLAQTESPPGVAVFDLGTGANGLGYDLTSIVTIASWGDSGFLNQNWTLEVAGVGDDGSLGSSDFVLLASANHQGLGSGGSSKVEIAGLSGALTSGVQHIRFTGLPSQGSSGRTTWRELDIDGSATPIPEPSAALLGALGGLFLLRRRR